MERAHQNYPKKCVNSKSPKIELDGFTKPGPTSPHTHTTQTQPHTPHQDPILTFNFAKCAKFEPLTSYSIVTFKPAIVLKEIEYKAKA